MGEGGVIFGDGGLNAPTVEDTAVISMQVTNRPGLEFDPDDSIANDMVPGEIVNNGVIASWRLPTFFQEGAPEAGEEFVFGNRDAEMRADFAGFEGYVREGGPRSPLDGDFHALDAYAEAAQATLLMGGPGAINLVNYDFMAGHVLLGGSNEPVSGKNFLGNTILNYGTWFVGEGPVLDTVVRGDGTDAIGNSGWMQAAFDDEVREHLRIATDTFYNGVPVPNPALAPFGVAPKTGLISLVDGMGGDEAELDIGVTSFIAPEEEAYQASYRSYVALDVFLEDDLAYLTRTSEDDNKDFLTVSGDVTGTTGLIIRRVNEETVDGVVGSRIAVAQTGGSINDDTCIDEFCQAGDPFYIADQSDGYFESEEGIGFIEDGLFAWGLVGENNVSSEDYHLVGLPGSGALNAPRVAQGFLDIANEVSDIVFDHGQELPGPGGGGADLPLDGSVYDAPAASGGIQTSLWAKVTGSHAERDSEVTEEGNTFDTNSDQRTYTILGGADMKWDPNSPIRLGIFGGYISSRLDFELGSSDVDYEGGMVGTYIAYDDGAFFADATLKAEFLTADYSFDSSVDAGGTNIGFSADTGYRFAMGSAYLEPLVSIRYVHSSVDDIESGGTVDLNDPESLKAGTGARIGAAFATGGATTELSLLGRVWNDFSDDNEVTVDDGNGNLFTFTDGSLGTYGEVAATVMVTSADGSLSGFLGGSGQFGDGYTKYGAKAGIRTDF
jgi:hypothetical protein